jgi:hypothetical protein
LITHITLVAASLWHLGTLFYHDPQYSQLGSFKKFTLVCYSVKQGTTRSPTSHLVHWYTLPFLWLREQHRQQHGWVNNFTGKCLSWWLSSRKTFFKPSAPDYEWVTATRISLTASSLSLIFPQITLRHLQWSALFRLLCMTAQLQKPNATEISISSTVTEKQI